MKELDDEVAELFAEDEPITDDGAFAAAVRQRVAQRRRWRRSAKIGLIAALSAAATTLAAFAPGALASLPLAVDGLLASPLVAVLGWAVMVWWNQAEEA